MSFWEKNTYMLGLGSLIGGGLYFGLVAWQSIQLGALAPPSVVTWLTCLAAQMVFSLAAMQFVSRQQKRADPDLLTLPGGEDERDQLIRHRSEARFGHFASALIFAAMALWFVHGSIAALFHSLVAAMFLAEILRAAFQLASYNRAI